MSAEQRLLVLDVHGVILTNPLLPFLADTARAVGRDPDVVRGEWDAYWRRPFWLGEVEPEALWAALFPGSDPNELTRSFEARHEPGPLFDTLPDLEGPIWLLSNHRSAWLLPRLERFGLSGRFERVYVSDAIGQVKPDPGAFEFVRTRAGGRSIRYVDDKPANVAAAARVFDESLLVASVVEPRSASPVPAAAQETRG